MLTKEYFQSGKEDDNEDYRHALIGTCQRCGWDIGIPMPDDALVGLVLLENLRKEHPGRDRHAHSNISQKTPRRIK
jgi:hypothetical protein